MLEKKYELPKGTEAAPADGSVTAAMRDFDDQELVTKVRSVSLHILSLCEKAGGDHSACR